MPTPLVIPSKADYQALASYRHALRRFLHFSTLAARAAGITQQQYQALLAVKSAAGPGLLTIGELAETMHVRHHSAVGLVDRLARRGLLKRVKDKVDQRRVRLDMTRRGDVVLAKLVNIHRGELRKLGPQLVKALQHLGAS